MNKIEVLEVNYICMYTSLKTTKNFTLKNKNKSINQDPSIHFRQYIHVRKETISDG